MPHDVHVRVRGRPLEPEAHLRFALPKMAVDGGHDHLELPQEVVGVVQAAVVQDVHLRRLEDVDARVFFPEGVNLLQLFPEPVGGEAARDALGFKTEIVGVVAKGAPAYALSFAAGEAISTNTVDTFADGVACRTPEADALAIMIMTPFWIVPIPPTPGIAMMSLSYWARMAAIVRWATITPVAIRSRT